MGIRQTLVLAVASWASTARAAPPASPSQANCGAAPVALDALVDATRRGEEAFAEMNLDGLERAHEAAVGVVPCLTERVSRVAAADFHRLVALKGFTDGDNQQVLAEFHAARRLVPGYLLPEDVAPEGHPLTLLYDLSETATEGTPDVAVPPLGGSVSVDGINGGYRSRGVTSIVQVFDVDQVLLESRVLQAGEPTPAWGPRPEELEASRRRHLLFGGATAVLGLTAAGTYTASLVVRGQYNRTDDVEVERLRVLRAQTNGLYWIAAGTGAATLLFGSVTAFTW